MLFFRGRDYTIVSAKDSSSLDVEIRNKHNQLDIMEKSYLPRLVLWIQIIIILRLR